MVTNLGQTDRELLLGSYDLIRPSDLPWISYISDRSPIYIFDIDINLPFFLGSTITVSDGQRTGDQSRPDIGLLLLGLVM